MKEPFIVKRFSVEAMERIDLCNGIIDDYMEQGLRLTLRQLYYQLVSKNAITNEEKSYKKLGGLVSDARLAGLMDWGAIEDRGRVPSTPSEWNTIGSLVETAIRAFRLPRWADQENYAELWVEKQALAGVLAPLASSFHVTLMVNKGYSSQSAMYESSKRFLEATEEGKELNLFYLGDHDPSGEDMVRDIEDRMAMFSVRDLAVVKLALTMDQIRQYNPPPNPAKLTDSRAAAYIEKYGYESWEVDALPPQVLAQLIRDAFSKIIDDRKLADILAQEEVLKRKLRKAAKNIDGGQGQ